MLRRLDRLPPLRAGDIARAAGWRADRPVLYYGYARQALGDALRWCGCAPGDSVLYPDFICDVTMEPVRRLGLKPVYYPVTDDLVPDWAALAHAAVRSGAGVVMSVNYFGIAQPMARWRRFVEDNALFWINDNAHGYGSRLNGIPLGAFGDVSVTSMRKVLPLINGAALRVNRTDITGGSRPAPPASPAAHLPIQEEIRRVWRSLTRALGIPHRSPAGTPYPRLPDADETATRFRAMDLLSRRLLERFDHRLSALAARRREIYTAWHAHCSADGLRPVFPQLTPEASPMVFPCYANDFDERQKWLEWALVQNVDVYPWPSLPEDCRQEGSAAVGRWRRLLCFPIHPFMAPASISARFDRP